MKLLLNVLGAVTLMASAAEATCYTNSRGYNFQGYDAASTTAACRAHSLTSNSECDRNVTCDYNGGGGGSQGCYTQSRGYEFRGYDASSTTSACRAHPSTSNAECDRNLVCSSVGYPGNPGYPPPGTGYPPPYEPPYNPPAPPPPPPPIGTPGGAVCFYEHAGFGGRSFCLNRGESISSLPREWNDRISSISIRAGLKVVMYEHGNFGGNVAEQTRSGDLPSAWWNDKISAVSVERDNSGGGGGGGYHPPQDPGFPPGGGGGIGPVPGPGPRPEPPRPQPPRPQPPTMSDAQCYLQRYPDICQNSKPYCKDPAAHYRNHGQAEGRIWGCQ